MTSDFFSREPIDLLAKWAEGELEQLGVDPVFAPYVCGLVNERPTQSQNRGQVPQRSSQEHADAVRTVTEVILGWVPAEEIQRVDRFVEQLFHYAGDSSSLAPLLADNSLPSPPLATTLAQASYHSPLLAVDQNPLLEKPTFNISAPSFVPGFIPQAPASTSAAVPPAGVDGHEAGEEDDSLHFEDDVLEGIIDSDAEMMWEMEHEMVESLVNKYPQCAIESLVDILRTLDYDSIVTEAAIQAILEQEQKTSAQVCRHYIHGECRRADCQFLHDTSKLTCRFWLRGSCMNADSCTFKHGYDPEIHKKEVESIKQSLEREELLDTSNTESFPSLGGSKEKAGSNATLSPSLDAFSLNFARAANIGASSNSPPRSGSNHRTNGSSKAYNALGVRQPARSQFRVAQTSWLVTGESVEKQYNKLRAEAANLAKARNHCFMNATAAFRGGNKALARELSQKGQAYNLRMKECHLEAANVIFNSRNSNEQIQTHRVLDLHALHVSEALALLESKFAELSEQGHEFINVVTGTGHHSKGPSQKARLRPAIERFLQAEGYQYEEVADRRGHVGMLRVSLLW